LRVFLDIDVDISTGLPNYPSNCNKERDLVKQVVSGVVDTTARIQELGLTESQMNAVFLPLAGLTYFQD